MYLTYETILLIFLLGFLAGVCIRPARVTLRRLRAMLRGHRAARRVAQPARRRRR